MIFLVFSGIVGVLWMGANDVRNGVMTEGVLIQFVIYSIIMAGSVAALSEIWSELQRAAGATERLVELLHAEDTVTDPGQPNSLPLPVRGEIRFEDVSFRYPARPDVVALDNLSLAGETGGDGGLCGPLGRGQDHRDPVDPAVL